MQIKYILTPINGISKFTRLFPATLFSTPLRVRKTQEIISYLLNQIQKHKGLVYGQAQLIKKGGALCFGD
jgi:hypothetical protein